ncbi:oligosaccharide flippase family protein [Shewanella sp. OMA3-2]|uniref:oligosaccharide flippase family protein n=1 Tax=Shewanella sp. OMA3-2 TaxID=2908650 RepID=UPI001F2F1068|nr:oligosaccharide flippase family protein [Shewanella sp. OMA3-2]UJF23368.1 oligosaccharide flippase family protein [Shewanella sp. OMA3-2]
MLAKKVLSTFFVKVFASLSSYLVSILLVREGGAELAGEFFSWLAYLLLISSIIRFGLDHKIVKEVAQSAGNATNIILGNALILCLLVSSIIIPIVYFFALYVGGWSNYIAVIISISCFIFSIVYLLGNVFQGLNRADLSIWSQEILVWSVLFIFLVFFESISFLQVWSLYLIGLFVSLIISARVLFMKYQLFPDFSQIKLLAFYVKDTLPYFSGIVGHVALQWLPLIFLSIFSTSEDVGFFVAIQRTALLIAFALGVFNLVTNPIYATYFSEGKTNSVGEVSRAISLLMLFVSLPFLIILIFYGELLIGFYGPEFKLLHSVFIVVAIAQLFNAVTGSASYILTMGGKAKLVEKSVIITLFVTIIIGGQLTFFYGLWGAAITSALSIILFNVLNVFFLYKYMNINIIPNVKSILYLFYYVKFFKRNCNVD